MGSCLLFVLVAATQAQKEQRWVILPPGAANTIPVKLFDDSIHLGSWQPSQADIDGLETNLKQVSTLKPTGWGSSPVRIEHPERYYRQYIGMTDPRQRLIYVNAFCNEPPENWKAQLYIVMDGWTCYWQAFYNPTTKQFSNLLINGRA